MKLVRFRRGNEILYGVLEGETILALKGSPFDEGWDYDNPCYGDGRCRLNDVTLLAPCEPTKYLGLGMNYKDLAAQVGAEIPTRPLTYSKPLCAVIGPGEKILMTREACEDKTGEGMIYEGELCVVIGKKGKHIARENAYDYVLGYTCTNDVTFRNEHGKDMIHSKGADGFGPIGPCISNEVDPCRAHIRSWVNGEKRQDGYSDQMVFDVPSTIAYFSSYMTLMPGDVIATGTPAGVRSIQAGDVIRIEIDGIGVLENTVADDL